MNKDVIIIGGGSSVSSGISLGLWNEIKEKEVWSLNFAFLTMPFIPKRELWVDVSFFKNNIDDLQVLYKKGCELHTKNHTKYNVFKEINQYETTRDKNGSGLWIGRLGQCGFFALVLATKESFDRIFLLGYDFGPPNVKDTMTHYYQDKIKVQSTGVGNPRAYYNDKGLIKAEVVDYQIFTNSRSKIYNVSLISNIPFFDKIDYPTMFKLLKEKE